eukprot:307285-Chlamydomonas_euryale.AAC.1
MDKPTGIHPALHHNAWTDRWIHARMQNLRCCMAQVDTRTGAELALLHGAGGWTGGRADGYKMDGWRNR